MTCGGFTVTNPSLGSRIDRNNLRLHHDETSTHVWTKVVGDDWPFLV